MPLQRVHFAVPVWYMRRKRPKKKLETSHAVRCTASVKSRSCDHSSCLCHPCLLPLVCRTRPALQAVCGRSHLPAGSSGPPSSFRNTLPSSQHPAPSTRELMGSLAFLRPISPFHSLPTCSPDLRGRVVPLRSSSWSLLPRDVLVDSYSPFLSGVCQNPSPSHSWPHGTLPDSPLPWGLVITF